MKTQCVRNAFLLIVGSVSVLPLYARNPVAAQAKPLHSKVVVVTLDGLPARALADPRLPMPTLRALAANGAAAAAMRPINPTVTWPNHTSLITGVNASEHFVMANGLIDVPANGGPPTVEPWVSKDNLVHARTLYEAATEKGLTTGQVDWVAIYGAKGVRWQFGEQPDAQGEIAKELVGSGTVTEQELARFGDASSPAWRDELWTDAAVDIIEKHKPDLLLVHLLQTDTIQHIYAPFTPAAYAAYAYADQCLARIVEAARNAGTLEQTTFFILSDHGFSTYNHTISPNALLLKHGYLQPQNGTFKSDVWVKAEGGAASVYVRNAGRREEILPRLKEYFSKTPGIQHVYTNAEAQAIGIPSDAKTNQAPQLYMVAKPGYAFIDQITGPIEQTTGSLGQHGYLNTEPDMQALFIASGAAIRSGIHLDSISNLQVAPTIATILGLSLPNATQSPLNQILR